jgi:hypothetical protein
MEARATVPAFVVLKDLSHGLLTSTRHSAREWDKFMPVYLSRFDLVGVAPNPIFARLDRADEGMCGCTEMFGRMFVL